MGKKIFSFFLALSIFSIPFVYGAVPQKNFTLRIRGDKLKFTNLWENRNTRERRNAGKIITDPNLKIVIPLFLTKGEIWDLPEDYKKITIKGKATATRAQAVALLQWYNPVLPVDATAEDLVNYYYAEATKEGIRWDMAFCQALLETGFFAFGGTVVPEQNNFCGLGTTSATVRGAYFLTPGMGVRAHIQHLLAYTTLEKPQNEIVDPRYKLVHDMKQKTGFSTTWYELNGKWATGSDYCEKIVTLQKEMENIITVSGNI